MRYNSLLVAHQNVPITAILTDFTLGSWKDFDVGLLLIGSKEMIWITCFVMSLNRRCTVVFTTSQTFAADQFEASTAFKSPGKHFQDFFSLIAQTIQIPYLPPAYVVRREGNVLTRVCPSICLSTGGESVSWLSWVGVSVSRLSRGGQSSRGGGGGRSSWEGGSSQPGEGGGSARGSVSQGRGLGQSARGVSRGGVQPR